MSETYYAGSGGINRRLVAIYASLALLIVVVLANAGPKRHKPKPVVYGYHGLPDFNVDPDAGPREMAILVKRTHGDYSKLTYDEQNWIESLTAHHGRDALEKQAAAADARERAARHKQKIAASHRASASSRVSQ